MGPTRGRNGGFRAMRQMVHILVGGGFRGGTWQASPLTFSNISITAWSQTFDMFMARI
jgi:hypothetical protein